MSLFYHELFYAMEATGVLDPCENIDLFALHSIFLPRIKRSLVQFARAWNLYPLRTEKNWSPQQIMINSLIKETDVALTSDIPIFKCGIK